MFYYHMFGLSVGSLVVKTKGTSVPETVFWIKYYSQGNRWHHVGVDIPSIEGLQVNVTLGSTVEKTLFPFFVKVNVSLFNFNTTANSPNFLVFVSINLNSYKI